MMIKLNELEAKGVRVGNEKLIKVTVNASDKLKQLVEREMSGSLLRIKITGGGCNGLSYKMHFTDQVKSGDILVNALESYVIIDPKTALFIKGTSLDYSNKLVGGGFKFDNPNAKSSCSCGESFSI